jgi:inner membrane protein
MASLGHVAVGLAAARTHGEGQRPHWRSAVAWSALSMLPDADVIGFSLGVRYEDPWGHRGATHSLAFALIVGAVVGLIAGRFKLGPSLPRRSSEKGVERRWALFATVVLATHPLLDTLTDGGLGCALFWPFDLTRYFSPWRPIQVAPIGLAFLSPYGAIVAMSEIVLFLPLFVFALRPADVKRQTSTFPLLYLVWLFAAWLIASTDPVREAVVATLLRDSTQFAQGFSESRFGSVTEGQSQTQVRQELGLPLEESWMYPPPGESPANVGIADATACAAIRFENERVSKTFPPMLCEARGIRPGQPKADVERLLGIPADSCWDYSKGPPGRAFRLRLVCFHGATVEMVARRWVF